MTEERYMEYINRFNAQDMTAFDDFIHPKLHMINGTLEYTGVDGMKDHYAKIWGKFSEDLTIYRFVSNDEFLAVHMWAHFTALIEDENSLFGPVKKGENFDFKGLIIYDLEDGKFKRIQVAYNSFSFTNVNGETTQMGIPH